MSTSDGAVTEAPVSSIVDAAGNSHSGGRNPHDIVCQFCGSLILLQDAATAATAADLTESNLQLPAMHAKHASKPEDFPMEECPGQWWRVNDMLEFENVGFSNSVAGVRYLICADCEKGPIGFCHRSWHLVSSARVKEQAKS